MTANTLKDNEAVDYEKVRLLVLDPASHITGYAYFEEWRDGIQLREFGNIRAKKDPAFDMRCFEINSKVRNIIVTKQCTSLVMEYPEFQSGSRGVSAARGGFTLILAYLCGAIATGWQLHMAEVMKKTQQLHLDVAQLVTPSKWKGQVKKEITAQRCEKLYHVLASGETEYNYTDAIMLGDYVLNDTGLPIKHIIEPERKDY